MSDPIGFGGTEQPAEDLRRLVETLAVGRVAVIGIGQGADDALAFAARYPALVTSVSAVSVRLPADGAETPPGLLHPFGRRHARSWAGPLACLDPDRGQGRRPDRRGDLVADAGPARRDGRPGAGRPVAGRPISGRPSPPMPRRSIRPGRPRPAPGGPAAWVLDPGAVRVPVEVWHGKHETGTTLAAVPAFAADLPGWTVRSAPGSSAVLGSWTGDPGARAPPARSRSAPAA